MSSPQLHDTSNCTNLMNHIFRVAFQMLIGNKSLFLSLYYYMFRASYCFSSFRMTGLSVGLASGRSFMNYMKIHQPDPQAYRETCHST